MAKSLVFAALVAINIDHTTSKNYWDHISTPNYTYFQLNTGDSLWSLDQLSGLQMQTDGNFVFIMRNCTNSTCPSNKIWSTDTLGPDDNHYIRLHWNGDMILYNANGDEKWNADSRIDDGIYPPNHLVVSNNGYAYILNNKMDVIWTTSLTFSPTITPTSTPTPNTSSLTITTTPLPTTNTLSPIIITPGQPTMTPVHVTGLSSYTTGVIADDDTKEWINILDTSQPYLYISISATIILCSFIACVVIYVMFDAKRNKSFKRQIAVDIQIKATKLRNEKISISSGTITIPSIQSPSDLVINPEIGMIVHNKRRKSKHKSKKKKKKKRKKKKKDGVEIDIFDNDEHIEGVGDDFNKTETEPTETNDIDVINQSSKAIPAFVE